MSVVGPPFVPLGMKASTVNRQQVVDASMAQGFDQWGVTSPNELAASDYGVLF